MCFAPDDIPKLEKRCKEIADSSSPLFSSMRRAPNEDLMTAFSKLQSLLVHLHQECAANNASDLFPGRLAVTDIVFDALVSDQNDRSAVSRYLKERARSGLGVDRKDLELNDLLEAIQWVERTTKSAPIVTEPAPGPAAQPPDTGDNDNRDTKQTKIADQKKALESQGGIVFNGRFQCWHCGEIGDGDRPHDARKCNQSKPCLNCGGLGHPTSICRAPVKEIFNANRQLLNLPIVCAPCLAQLPDEDDEPMFIAGGPAIYGIF
jgi:hypothetical protein